LPPPPPPSPLFPYTTLFRSLRKSPLHRAERRGFPPGARRPRAERTETRPPNRSPVHPPGVGVRKPGLRSYSIDLRVTAGWAGEVSRAQPTSALVYLAKPSRAQDCPNHLKKPLRSAFRRRLATELASAYTEFAARYSDSRQE